MISEKILSDSGIGFATLLAVEQAACGWVGVTSKHLGRPRIRVWWDRTTSLNKNLA